MKGCLSTVGILAVILLICGIVVAYKWKSWAASATTQVAEQAIQKSGLPPAQQAQLKAEIKKVADDFAAGRITTADLERMMRGVATGPFIPAATVVSARQKYLASAGLNAAEQAAATRALQRYARTLFEKNVPLASARAVLDTILVPKGGQGIIKVGDNPVLVTSDAGENNVVLKETVTRAELDQFVALAKKAADDAKTPDEAYEPNWADEVTKAIGSARKTP